MKRCHECGASTLAMCLVLLGVLALGAAWAVRQLTTAQQVAANDLRAAAAFEAAESGLAWAVAMLNGGAVDDACRPAIAASVGVSGTVATTDFRARFLSIGPDGHYRPLADATTDAPPNTTANATPGAPTTGRATSPLASPACSNAAPLRWRCQCGGDSAPGAPEDTAPRGDDALRPRFSIRFADAGGPGQLRIISRGCSDARQDCDTLSEGPAGLAESAQQLALLSALRLPPPSARIEGPGSFLRVFGYPPARYRGQPAIARLRCAGDCTVPLAQALARGRRLVWIDGDARLPQWPEAALDGTPLVLVVNGRLDMQAGGHAQGVLYARDGVAWHPPAGMAASLRGAIVTDGSVATGRSVELIHDAAVLYRIHRQMGSFLPVPGGWIPTR